MHLEPLHRCTAAISAGCHGHRSHADSDVDIIFDGLLSEIAHDTTIDNYLKMNVVGFGYFQRPISGEGRVPHAV